MTWDSKVSSSSGISSSICWRARASSSPSACLASSTSASVIHIARRPMWKPMPREMLAKARSESTPSSTIAARSPIAWASSSVNTTVSSSTGVKPRERQYTEVRRSAIPCCSARSRREYLRGPCRSTFSSAPTLRRTEEKRRLRSRISCSSRAVSSASSAERSGSSCVCVDTTSTVPVGTRVSRAPSAPSSASRSPRSSIPSVTARSLASECPASPCLLLLVCSWSVRWGRARAAGSGRRGP